VGSEVELLVRTNELVREKSVIVRAKMLLYEPLSVVVLTKCFSICWFTTRYINFYHLALS